MTHYDLLTTTQQIERGTDAEIAFGEYLERSGVDCDEFMGQWHISQSQFNRISHYLYGLTEDVVALPPALIAILKVSRQLQAAQPEPLIYCLIPSRSVTCRSAARLLQVSVRPLGQRTVTVALVASFRPTWTRESDEERYEPSAWQSSVRD